MKSTKEIDQYFTMEDPPHVEMEERRPSVRRVSFALEPQIVYPPAKDENSKSESSSMGMSMDMSSRAPMDVDAVGSALEDELVGNETLPLCEEKEENFIMDDSEDTMEEKRMSLCPVDREKTMEQTAIHIEVPEGGEAGREREIEAPEGAETPSAGPAQPAGSLEAECKMEYSLDDGRDDILSDMLSEIVCAADNNTLVYDTVNVEEVLSKYKTEKREETKKIREILAETGIRFLDNLSLGSRRETLSKIRNKVEEGSLIYYREFLHRRIEMQNALSARLSGEIEKTREETEAVEREVDCTGLASIDRNTLLSKLRQMKSDARKEGKSHWHRKRLEMESEFLAESVKLLGAYEKEKSDLQKRVEKAKKDALKVDLQGLEQKERAMREMLASVGTLSHEEVSRFVQEVEEEKKVEESLSARMKELAAQLEEAREKEGAVSGAIEGERAEIEMLQDSLQAAEVQKDDLEQIKSAVQRMEIILGVRIVEISHSRLILSICDINITIIYDGVSIVDVYAETEMKSLFKEFTSLSMGAVLASMDLLVESIPVLIRYILEMASVEKEVKKLGVSVPYEVHYTEKELTVQFMIRKGKTGQMGNVSAVFRAGKAAPEISSNIKGVRISESRHGRITETVECAREVAHVK
ncbi:uncharacterized protein NEMAJ01_0559 [Nematocida major]|uniref:uncharacterized protein n=1 Tax=Nematocida major TaxID=1912982 RepID=UPI0020088D51|nr:uncharacterized protein NEMAJ01_0559 [Nematocida major]KAH9385663.1 hypothetical protein NEMAJ01_0559 [Nematocida major]